jgi:hypothetical protein
MWCCWDHSAGRVHEPVEAAKLEITDQGRLRSLPLNVHELVARRAMRAFEARCGNELLLASCRRQDPIRTRRLSQRKTEHVVLLGPFGGQSSEAGDAEPMGQPPVDGRLDEIRGEEGK